MKILICDSFDASLPERLKEFGEVFTDISKLPEANVALIRSKTTANQEFIDKAPNLKLIIRGGVGIDNIDSAYAKTKGITVMNTPAASSVAVAELAVAMMLGLINHLAGADKSIREGKFEKKKFTRTELYKKTLGLLGVGRIGTEVAIRCKAFGMHVIAYDPYLTTHDVAELDNNLDSFLSRADFISIHTPLTDETKGMVNKDMIARMKDDVKIINTGRGKVVNEADIVEGLKSGKIGGFSTDVWQKDAAEFTEAFREVPNTLLLPHLGASSKENLLRIGDIVVDILKNFKCCQ